MRVQKRRETEQGITELDRNFEFMNLHWEGSTWQHFNVNKGELF